MSMEQDDQLSVEADSTSGSLSAANAMTMSWDAAPVSPSSGMDDIDILLDENVESGETDGGLQIPILQSAGSQDDSEEWEQYRFFSWATLRRLARQLSPILVPLPFALLIFLFTLPALIKGSASLPAIPFVIVLLTLVVIQGIFLYYAGANDGLWLLYTVLGYIAFLLVGAFAIFGLLGSLITLLLALALGAVVGSRSLRQVPEGAADIVLQFGKYSRTLFPGLNFLLPWEKVASREVTKEITWTTENIRVNISKDQDVDIRTTISYQLMPEDAHLAGLGHDNWQESLQQHLYGIIKSVVYELAPSEFVAWAHHIHTRLGLDDLTDPMTKTSWDHLNEALRQRMQDEVAARGILINMVHVQDITVIPHLAGAAEPLTFSRTRGAPSASAPEAMQPLQAINVPPPPPAQPAIPRVEVPPPGSIPVPPPAIYDMLVNAYKSVRDKRITDAETIHRLALDFYAIANDAEASSAFEYDAARAANNLFQREQELRIEEARMAAAAAAAATVPERRVPLPPDNNLTVGG